MPYQIGDRVQLAEELGGLTGVIFDRVGGPGPGGSYRIAGRYGEAQDNDGAVVGDDQIVAGPLEQPVFEVGQAVTLAAEPATIVAIDGELITVAIEVELGRRRWRRRGREVECVRYIREHRVPLWRLALEN